MYSNYRRSNSGLYSRSASSRRVKENADTVRVIKSLLSGHRKEGNGRSTVVKLTKQKSSIFDVSVIADDLFSSLKSTFNRSEVLLCIIFSGTIIYSMYTNFSSNPLGQWAISACKTNALAKWIVLHYMQLFGMLIFLPTCLDLNKDIKFFSVVMTALWCYMVPEASIYEYFIQSIALHSFFKVSHHQSKVFILIFVGTAYYFGFLFSSGVSQTLIHKNSTMCG